jgi:hypothetical protein
MRIKKLPNRRRVILEFEEFYVNDDADRVKLIDSLANDFNARRMAYNMWEFADYTKAEEFIFVYKLKYENNS